MQTQIASRLIATCTETYTEYSGSLRGSQRNLPTLEGIKMFYEITFALVFLGTGAICGYAFSIIQLHRKRHLKD